MYAAHGRSKSLHDVYAGDRRMANPYNLTTNHYLDIAGEARQKLSETGLSSPPAPRVTSYVEAAQRGPLNGR